MGMMGSAVGRHAPRAVRRSGVRLTHAVVVWLLSMASKEREPRTADATDGPATTTDSGGTRSNPRAVADAIYQQHARAVLAYLSHRLPNLPDAEDMLADVFVAALRACAAGETPGLPWLLTVARRRVADFYRQRRQTPASGAIYSATLALPADAHAQPEAAALQAEEHRELLALVAQLPDDQQEALALRFAAGLRSPQIAMILGRSDEATRALLSRAVRRLRKEWTR